MRTALIVIPLARKSRINETQMRCPRMQGLPKQTFGLMAIRDSNSSLVIRISLFSCQKVNPKNPLSQHDIGNIKKIDPFIKMKRQAPEFRLAFIYQVR
jgi:hypothetical protein